MQEVLAFKNTNFDKQSELLVHGLSMLLEHVQGRAVGALGLEKAAKK